MKFRIKKIAETLEQHVIFIWHRHTRVETRDIDSIMKTLKAGEFQKLLFNIRDANEVIRSI